LNKNKYLLIQKNLLKNLHFQKIEWGEGGVDSEPNLFLDQAKVFTKKRWRANSKLKKLEVGKKIVLNHSSTIKLLFIG